MNRFLIYIAQMKRWLEEVEQKLQYIELPEDVEDKLMTDGSKWVTEVTKAIVHKIKGGKQKLAVDSEYIETTKEWLSDVEKVLVNDKVPVETKRDILRMTLEWYTDEDIEVISEIDFDEYPTLKRFIKEATENGIKQALEKVIGCKR